MSDYYPFAPKEQERELCRSEARRCFSRVGWACCAMMLAAQLGAVLLTFGCQLLAMRGSRVMIAFIQSVWFQWVITDAANYGLGLPLMLWVLYGGARPAALPRRQRRSPPGQQCAGQQEGQQLPFPLRSAHIGNTCIPCHIMISARMPTTAAKGTRDFKNPCRSSS